MKIIQIVSAIGVSTPNETVAFYALTSDGKIWARICRSNGWQWRQVPPIK